jgi:hypothetical protein
LIDKLGQWLQKQAYALTSATLYRAPNMLPDPEDITDFVFMLAGNVSRTREVQLSAVQFWALTRIGYDARAASDWLTLLRVLKEEIDKQLEQNFSPAEILSAWRSLDDLFTFAFIEATQLASDIDHAALLEHAQTLRAQMDTFEKS